MTTITRRTNTVQTVLSQDAADALGSFLYWFHENIDADTLVDKLMLLLTTYVEHCPDTAHQFRKPEYMTLFVSELIQLKDHLTDIVNKEKPWNWTDTADGWGLPEPE